MLILHSFFFPKVSFPYKECDATNRLDVLLLHELKETFCHLSEVCWEAVVVSQLFLFFANLAWYLRKGLQRNKLLFAGTKWQTMN